MTVGKEDPATDLRGFFEHAFELVTLSSSHGKRDHLGAIVIGKLLKIWGRVDTGSQHEDDWLTALRGREYVFQVRRHTLCEVWAEEFLNILLDSLLHAIRPQTAKHNHSLEALFALGLPFSRQSSLLRIVVLIPALPVFSNSDCLGDSLERFR